MHVSKCYYIWITYILNIYPNDSKTGKINLLNETHGKEMQCWPFKTVRIKRSIIKLSYFKQYLYYVAIFGTNYHKKCNWTLTTVSCRLDSSAWAILENRTLVVLVHYLETAISIKTLSPLYSSLSSSLSLFNSISKPTIDCLLFTPRRLHLPSCKHFAFIRSHSTGNSPVLITHARIRSGRGQSYSRKFNSRIRPVPTPKRTSDSIHTVIGCLLSWSMPWLFSLMLPR